MIRPSSVRIRQAFERFFDVTCSAAGLLFLMPVFAGIAWMIVRDDGRPVFFSQTRVGRKGKPFRIWKFRTMRAGSHGSVITAAGDGRVTRAGAMLRKCKLDELPQLFNVLKGEMSLVGPRPEVPEHVRLEDTDWQAVLEVRPGITDLATLLYRDEERLLGCGPRSEYVLPRNVLPTKLFLNLGTSFEVLLADLKLIFLTVRYSLFPQRFDPNLIEEVLVLESANE